MKKATLEIRVPVEMVSAMTSSEKPHMIGSIFCS